LTRLGEHVKRLLSQIAVLACLALAAVSAALWVASSTRGSIGIFSLGWSTDLRFERGEAQLRHVYEYDIAPPVPADQWHATAISRGWVAPPSRQGRFPSFAFSSGHVLGQSGPSAAAASPARYWLLYVPLWATILPGILSGAWTGARWARRRQERRRGFAVVTDSKVPQGPPMQRTGWQEAS
jgi:hypothetical protein